MNAFLMFYAPFLVLIGGIVIAFWSAAKDDPVYKNEKT